MERGRWPPEAVVEQSAEAVLGRYYRTAQAWSEWHVHPWLPLLTCPLDRLHLRVGEGLGDLGRAQRASR